MDSFEQHINTHFASLIALSGAEEATYRHTIKSALRGTWDAACKIEREACANWLRRNANAETNPDKRAAFIEAHNATLARGNE